MVRNAYYINQGGNTRNKKSADCNIHMRKLQSADAQQNISIDRQSELF